MANPTTITDNSSEEKNAWIAVLNPAVKTGLTHGSGQAGTGQGAAAAAGNAPGFAGIGDNVMHADSQPSGFVKGGVEVEVFTKEFPPTSVKYAVLTISCTLKFSISGSAGGSGFGSTSTGTLKDKKGGRTPGIKQGFSDKDIADLEIFKGLSLNGISVGVDGEISGTEISVAASVTGNVVTAAFTAPASGKLTLFKVGSKTKPPSFEFKISPQEFKVKIGGAEAKVNAEFKATLEPDWKKIGLDVVEGLIKKEVKQEAEKQATKLLTKEAADLLLKDLGPLAAAFSVGLDIGGLLYEYTVTPKVAGAVLDAVLGDLNEQYQKADMLGKLWLLHQNAPKIAAAMLAASVAGAVAGMGDVLLFKIMGLPTMKDFEEAYQLYVADIHEMGKVVKLTRDAIQKIGPGSIAYGAIMLGIKSNPKHAICAHGSLEKIIAAIYAKIHPLYKPNGINELISVKVGNAAVDEPMQKFAKFTFDFKADYAAEIDVTSEQTIADAFKGMLIAEFLGILERHKMIKYNVKIDGNMDADAIDPNLLDELYAGTPLENMK